MKRGVAALLAILLLLISGCWDYREIGDMQMVSGMGIEPGDKTKYRLYIELVRTSEFVSDKRLGSSRSYVMEQEVNTIADGVTILNQKLNKHIEFSHMQLLVMDQALLSSGDLSYLDFIERYREVRNNILLVGASTGKVKSVMTTLSPDLSVSTYKIREQLQQYYRDYGGTYPIKLLHFTRELSESGKNPVIPMVTVASQSPKGSTLDAAKELELKDIVELRGVGVFRAGKLVGVLNNKQYRDSMLINNKLVESALEMPCSDKSFVSLYLQHQSSKLHARLENRVVRLQADVDLIARLDESQCRGYYDGSSKDYDKIESQAEELLKSKIENIIRLLQKQYRSDIFGFGYALRESDFKAYKEVEDEWHDRFAQAEVEVTVHVGLRRSGIRYGSIEQKN
ncbi:Ger(x)C family spore germination protein [Paenibacillus sp. GCM10023252]|uniref:Ger(x)C family spore germination protein n=1 Tax=Paenibacillus sp. GCM10023252 TaxID=3252649 RepID=UPI0036080686